MHLVDFVIKIYHDARSSEHLSRCTVAWTFITMHGHLNIYYDAGYLNIYHDARSPEHLSRRTVTWTSNAVEDYKENKYNEQNLCTKILWRITEYSK